MILLFAISCVVSLLIGIALGYGIQAQGLMGAAVSPDDGVLGSESDEAGMLGGSRPNYIGWYDFTCVSCGKETGNYANPGEALVCPLCGAENPK